MFTKMGPKMFTKMGPNISNPKSIENNYIKWSSVQLLTPVNLSKKKRQETPRATVWGFFLVHISVRCFGPPDARQCLLAGGGRGVGVGTLALGLAGGGQRGDSLASGLASGG